MKIIAPAKINLYLHITGRCENGYHLLNSIFVFTQFGDEITITPAASLTLTIDGPFSTALSNTAIENNLIFRAAMLLKKQYNINDGAHICLTKRIPLAAGLGGGSSNAAAILKGLNELWNLQLENEKLAEIGLTLGADIPACLYQKTALISGIGEQIKPIDLPFQSMTLLLINPNLPLSTQAVFKQYHRDNPPFSPAVDINSLKTPSDCSLLKNDLEKPAITLLPVIQELIHFVEKQDGCIFARMSGSGPTCFGLFSDLTLAERALSHFENRYPNYWTKLTTVLSQKPSSSSGIDIYKNSVKLEWH